jgi:hypothetical protein
MERVHSSAAQRSGTVLGGGLATVDMLRDLVGESWLIQGFADRLVDNNELT